MAIFGCLIISFGAAAQHGGLSESLNTLCDASMLIKVLVTVVLVVVLQHKAFIKTDTHTDVSTVKSFPKTDEKIRNLVLSLFKFLSDIYCTHIFTYLTAVNLK